MVPSLGRHVARAGDKVSASLGMGARYFAWPSRIEVSLVAVSDAAVVNSRDDPRLVRVATLRPDGGFISNRFRFVVPTLPYGDYTLAVWMRNRVTRQWWNAVAYSYSYADFTRRMALRIVGT